MATVAVAHRDFLLCHYCNTVLPSDCDACVSGSLNRLECVLCTTRKRSELQRPCPRSPRKHCQGLINVFERGECHVQAGWLSRERHGTLMCIVLTDLEEAALWAENGDVTVIPGTAASRHLASYELTASEPCL